MGKNEKQRLLDEIAKRDEIIARQAAEILILRQNIDALSRRIFGASSEKLDPGQALFDFGPASIANEPPAVGGPPVEPLNLKRTEIVEKSTFTSEFWPLIPWLIRATPLPTGPRGCRWRSSLA